MKTQHLLFLLSLLFLTTRIGAGPVASKVVSLKGEVVSVVWIDGFAFESDGAGLMSSGSKSPAHYIVLETESGTEEERGQLSGYLLFGLSKWPHWSVAKVKLDKNQVMISIPGKRIKELTKGAKIEVIDYQVKGDEWSTFSIFEELLVAGQSVNTKAEQAAAGDGDNAAN
ncbi:hypothetical protein ACFQY0_13485 [Haloferula chungangensis]|uniref:Uncharacterized protein n=1 Tax=Haloferula chungangensis TaxID=1048331 RepID=A0ABW2L9S6_9BACT